MDNPDDIAREIKGALPDKAQIKAYIDNSDRPLDKRDLARVFGLKGAQRAALRDILKEMEDDGQIERGPKKKIAPKGALPEVLVLVIDRLDA
ncbi:MAG: ribonuclease R, partial [Alphaproteobacteria bacterium]|nr:ribonuclease R [Alphaproteobacteria bacterium]